MAEEAFENGRITNYEGLVTFTLDQVLEYLATGSTLMAVGPSQSPAPQPGTLSWILSGTRPSVQTVSDVC